MSVAKARFQVISNFTIGLRYCSTYSTLFSNVTVFFSAQLQKIFVGEQSKSFEGVQREHKKLFEKDNLAQP